jgi:hypothetical protein
MGGVLVWSLVNILFGPTFLFGLFGHLFGFIFEFRAVLPVNMLFLVWWCGKFWWFRHERGPPHG